MPTGFIAVDLAKVYKEANKRSGLLTVLAWGDPVDVVETTATAIKIRLQDFQEGTDGSITPIVRTGYILPGRSARNEVVRPLDEKNVLMVSFVDVQQGDGCVVETPDGKVMLIDGGENQLFARYLAARYPGSSPDNPKVIDCIVITHGDADHYAGLPKILDSEKNPNSRKRLFIKPQRVYHNGIVKRPGKDADKKKVPDTKLLGRTEKKDGKLYLTELHDNLLLVPDPELNTPFKAWKKALKKYADFYGAPQQKRLDHLSEQAFDFLDGVEMEILGPIVEQVNGGPALKFLMEPPKSVQQAARDEERSSYSASHTINGHSIILRMKYGNVRFLFAGDLNEEAEDLLVAHARTGAQSIQAEVLKVPHHGSADFSGKFLEAVSPLVSVVSSGDESAQKEYIHPRATLMGALGKHSRVERPLIFVTEMVAFWKMEGFSKRLKGSQNSFFAFSRSAFGIVHVRTDGNRLLVFTHSGKRELKEAYAYTIDSEGAEPVRQNVTIV